MILAKLNSLVQSGKATKAQVEEFGKRLPTAHETRSLLSNLSFNKVRKEALYIQRKDNLEKRHKQKATSFNLRF